MPKAVYTLTREQKRRICEWITRHKFSDGYASNMARCVDMKEFRLHGMKRHDCHVFMQKLILIAFREMLPESVWSALIEIMFSGTPPVPRSRARGRGPPLPAASSDAFRIGGAVSFPSPPLATTPPSPAPQTPDDARPSTGAPTSEETGMQSVVPAAAPVPPPPPAVHPPSARQYISLDDARSDRRFHERINAVVRGHFPHPWSCLRQVPVEHQHFWFESMKVMKLQSPIDGTVRTSPYSGSSTCSSGSTFGRPFRVAQSSMVKLLWLANEIWLQLQVYWASEGF
ncbi:UNVERIFIED_CONTAM: hypothetical protein Slati_0844200 [Sesamum latifolium]|uniref:Uncharacterized protein n=1 Tax=Sesamum latifolium TaxID=2727402 RepID=A0AAW2XM25_9LAMI